MNECLSGRSFNEDEGYQSETGVRIQVSLEHARHLHRCCSRPNKYRYHLPHRCYICNKKWSQVTDLSVRVATLNQNDTCYHHGEIAIISVRACTHTCNLPHSFRVEGSSFEFDLLNRTAYCEQLKMMGVPNYHSLRLHRNLLVLMCLVVSFSKKLKLQSRVYRTCSFINFKVPTMSKVVKLMHQES